MIIRFRLGMFYQNTVAFEHNGKVHFVNGIAGVNSREHFEPFRQ